MSSESLRAQIQTSMMNAMRAQDKVKLPIIRLVQAAIKQREVDERITLTDDQILDTLDKMIRQRRDSIKQFEDANRQDLADKEAAEIVIIQEYLPAQLSAAEVEALVSEAIKSVNAASIRDMGKVMDILKPQLKGRADITTVGALVKNQLAS